MKKTIQILFFLCFISNVFTTQAQISVGVRGGVNISHYRFISSSDAENTDKWPLLTVGIPVEYSFNKYFALQAEINLVQKGLKLNVEQKIQLDSTNQTYIQYIWDNKLKINWLEIPILAKVKFRTAKLGGSLFLGPTIGYAINVERTGTTTTNIVGNGVIKETSTVKRDLLGDREHNRFDVGLNFGGEINYKSAYLDIRYQLGFNDMLKRNHPSQTHNYSRGLALTVGYRFWTSTKRSKT